MSLTVSLRANNLGALGAAIQAKAVAAVRQTALDIENEAAHNAHVVTGSMRASLYHAINDGESNYAAHAGDAEQLNARAIIVDEVAPTLSPEPGMAAVVGVAVKHGVYEEARQGHQFLTPAAEAIRPVWEARIRAIAS